MPLCLFEDPAVPHLFPLALTRAAGDLHVGARTLIEAQRVAFAVTGEDVHLAVRPAVAAVTAREHLDLCLNRAGAGGTLFVNQRWLVRDGDLLDRIRAARGGPPRAFVQAEPDGDVLIAAWLPESDARLFQRDLSGPDTLGDMPVERVEGATLVSRLWHLIEELPARIAHDLDALGELGDHAGADVRDGARLVVPERIHLAPGAVVRPGAILDAERGPIRLDAGAVVEENAVVRGPLWLGAKSTIKAGTRVDGSAIGPQAKVAGEVHESVLVGLSNKAHEGYLGNSYLGRWCNLGAGTDTSNLRNDYGAVSLYDAVAGGFLDTGRQFAGLLMGDHAKCAIGTTFNTGTVVGVFANVFGAGFPPRFLPSFSWGGADGLETYRLEKALRVAEAVMARRNVPLTDDDRALLAAVFEATGPERVG